MFVCLKIRQGPDTVTLWNKFLPELYVEFILLAGTTQSDIGINLRFLKDEKAYNFVDLNSIQG